MYITNELKLLIDTVSGINLIKMNCLIENY